MISPILSPIACPIFSPIACPILSPPCPRPYLTHDPTKDDWRYVKTVVGSRRKTVSNESGIEREYETFYLDENRWIQLTYDVNNYIVDSLFGDRNVEFKKSVRIAELDVQTGGTLIETLNTAAIRAQLSNGIAAIDVITGITIFNNCREQIFPPTTDCETEMTY
jgi:hypothetical protein